MKKYKIAIIGASGSGYKRTIPGLSASDICEVSAIQGRDINKLHKISQEHNIPSVYTETADMVKKGDFDIIYIATPPFLHFSDITLAIKSQKPIICEKPVAQNIQEAKKIEALLARSPQIPFMLAHHLRHQPAINEIKDILDKGSIGQILSAWGQWGFLMNKAAGNAKWKLEPALGGFGPFSDAGIHVIDLFIYLFGIPSKVLAHGFTFDFPKALDNTTAIFCYPQMTITLNSSQTMNNAGNNLLIYGTKGSIEVNNAFGEKSIKSVKVKTNNDEKILEYLPVNMYKLEVENFVAAVFMNKKFQGTNIQEAMAGVRLIESINMSIQKNEGIDFHDDF